MCHLRKTNIAVLILFMEHQWAATKLTLTSIYNKLPPNTKVVLLLNGSKSEIIRKELKEVYPSFILYESQTNLGVAGGRNFLLKTHQAISANYIFHLDNDVLLPENYFDHMIDFLKQHPEAGIIGPLIFRAHYLLLYFFEDKIFHGTRTPTNLYPHLALDSSKVISDWIQNGFPEPWHFGVTENWYLAYCSIGVRILNKLCRPLGLSPLIPTFHKYNSRILKLIKTRNEPIRSSNIAGCGTLYRRQLIEDVGLYDESFNPYSLEDVEFCVRAMRKGYINYINPKVVLFHGTDNRSKNTKSYFSVKQEIKTFILIRRRLIKNHFRLFFSLSSYLICLFIWSVYFSLKSLSFLPIREYISGIIEGVKLEPQYLTCPCKK